MAHSNGAAYEFSAEQNAHFTRLAAVMWSTGLSILLAGAGIGAALAGLARFSVAGAVVLAAPLAVLLVAAVQLCIAARRLRRIAATRGNDVGNLLAAIDWLTTSYRLQRWLWIAALAVAAAGWATTLTGD